MTTLLIIVVVFLLLGGGGYYGFRRWQKLVVGVSQQFSRHAPGLAADSGPTLGKAPTSVSWACKMVSIFMQIAVYSTDLMWAFLIMSGLAALIVVLTSWLFVASFSIAGTSFAADCVIGVFAASLGKIWMATLPRMLAFYNGIGGGAACACGMSVIAGSGAMQAPALMGVLIGGVAISGSLIAWPKIDWPGGVSVPVHLSLCNSLAGFAIALEGLAVRSAALVIAGLIIATARALMTMLMASSQLSANPDTRHQQALLL